MSTSAFSVFFASLTLACWVGIIIAWMIAFARWRAPDSAIADVYDDLAEVALWLAALVAITTMLGSLYYSEVAHFIPCKLCWYQRILVYPLSITLVVGALRRDRKVWWYVVPQATLGALIAIYHTQLQAFPSQSEAFCTTTEPCTTRYVWEWGFVSLPLMALTAFAAIITLVLIARSAGST